MTEEYTIVNSSSFEPTLEELEETSKSLANTLKENFTSISDEIKLSLDELPLLVSAIGRQEKLDDAKRKFLNHIGKDGIESARDALTQLEAIASAIESYIDGTESFVTLLSENNKAADAD